MIIGDKDGWHEADYYIFAGGRGSCKSKAQLDLLKKQLELWADIQDCNRELDKMKNRQSTEG